MTTTVRFPLARVAAGAALIFATAIAIVAPVVEAMPARAADSYLVKGPGFTPAVPVDGGLSPRNAVPANENYQIVLVGLARDTLGDRLFVLGGRVIAGPTCPVERVPPEPGCADRPVHGAALRLLNQRGELVAVLVSDADGQFRLSIAAGVYTLEPQPVPGLLGTAPRQDISVAADVDVTVRYDTGIR